MGEFQNVYFAVKRALCLSWLKLRYTHSVQTTKNILQSFDAIIEKYEEVGDLFYYLLTLGGGLHKVFVVLSMMKLAIYIHVHHFIKEVCES